jgi:hypothetical protein
MRSNYDDAIEGLLDDIAASGDHEQPEYTVELYPSDDHEHDHEHVPFASYTFEDHHGNQWVPDANEVGDLLASMAERYDELSPEDHELAQELAHELRAVQAYEHELDAAVEVLQGITEHLRREGYDPEDFARELAASGGDLDHALHAVSELGPIPRDLDAAISQMLVRGRHDRLAAGRDTA